MKMAGKFVTLETRGKLGRINFRKGKIIGTLRFNDATATRTCKKKPTGLIGKTTTLHVHHAFSYISLPFLHE